MSEDAFGMGKTAVRIVSGAGCKNLVGFKIFAILKAIMLIFILAIFSSHGSPVVAGDQGEKSQNLFVESHQTEPGVTGAIKKIREIRFELTSEGEEKVFFVLNGFYPPEIFVLEGESPRAVCDFYNTRLDNSIGRLIEVNGRFIHQIRTAVHRGARPKVRVVLDFMPKKNYEVEQIFFKKEKLYILIVRLGKAPYVDIVD